MTKSTFGNNKWPDVPDCYGWLSLDARGRWYIQNKPVSHSKLQDYLSENYRCDERHRWFVQNGPQRVFVELEATPWIYRISPDKPGCLISHTGKPAGEVSEVFQDDNGNLLIYAQLGLGKVDDRELGLLSTMMEEKQGSLFFRLGSKEFLVNNITQKQLNIRWPYISVPVETRLSRRD